MQTDETAADWDNSSLSTGKKSKEVIYQSAVTVLHYMQP